MRVFVTGGAGFIGSSVVRQLRARGDEVVAAVRDPARAQALAELGCRLEASDLGSREALSELMGDAAAVIHGAGSYRVGIRPSERAAMEDANVGATARVLDAAIAAAVPRVVYVSTGNVYGDTRGQVVDESYRRDPGAGFLSVYDETKYRAHEAAVARIAAGAPIVIVLPGQAYGPHDHSEVGAQFRRAYTGHLPYLVLAEVGLCMGHVDDIAAGIVAALDRGRVGEAYNVAGAPRRLRDGLEIAARVGGRRLPRLTVPAAALRLVAPLAPYLPGSFGLPPNLSEVISAGDGVTYWIASAKAERELGFVARDLETGLRATFAVT
jgi:nucleoside-diphosphate-sugar epimerase